MSPVFSFKTPPPPELRIPSVPGLDRYCLYRWTGKDAPDLGALPKGIRLAPDCRVAALGNHVTDVSWPAVRTAFRQRLEALDSLPVGADRPPGKIRVAVLDTFEGDGRPLPLEVQPGHGFAVGAMIRELACPDGQDAPACIPKVTAYGATSGGLPYGTQTDLAAAIQRALTDWIERPGAEQHLVLNISLGWEPFDDNGDPSSPAARTVHDMLVRAACLGATVVVAAGNDPGGPDRASGPTLPAAWERLPRPTDVQCGRKPQRASPGLYRPLLYSVGGLGTDDTALVTGRRAGRPRLAAPATHGLAGARDERGQPAPTSVLTGTSVAAAVVSGMAATIWGYRPALAGPEVMDLVYASAAHLREAADYCLRPPDGSVRCGNIRRVSLCSALRLACRGGGGACPTELPECKTRPPYANLGARLTDEQYAALGEQSVTVVAGDFATTSGVPDVCPRPHQTEVSRHPPKFPCPERQLPSAGMHPWSILPNAPHTPAPAPAPAPAPSQLVGPQPSSDPCPTCWIRENGGGTLARTAMFAVQAEGEPPARVRSGTGTLYLAIDSRWRGTLDDPILWVPGIGALALPELRLQPDGTVVVRNIPLPAEPAPGAYVSFTVRNEGVVVGSAVSVLLDQLP